MEAETKPFKSSSLSTTVVKPRFHEQGCAASPSSEQVCQQGYQGCAASTEVSKRPPQTEQVCQQGLPKGTVVTWPNMTDFNLYKVYFIHVLELNRRSLIQCGISRCNLSH